MHTRSWMLLLCGLGGSMAAGLAVLGLGGGAAPTLPVLVEPDLPAPVALSRVDDHLPARESLDDRVEGLYAAPRGTQLTFIVHVESTAGVGDPGDHGAVTTRIAGQMIVLVVGRRDGEAMVEVRFPDLAVELVGEGGDEARAWREGLAVALADPTTVLMASSGQTLGYRFPAGMVSDHRNWVRTLVSEFRFVVSADGATRWVTSEEDATGSAQVRYHAESGSAGEVTVVRDKVGYDDPHVAPCGSARAVFRGDVPWLCEARVDEGLVARVPEIGIEIRHHFVGTLRCSDLSLTAVSAGADWDGAWAPVGGRDERSELAAAAIALQWRTRLRSVSVEDLLARLATLTGQSSADGKERGELEQLLARLVEFRPETVRSIEARLRDWQTAPEVAAMLLTVLGMAGTEPAQDLLAAVAEDDCAPADLRRCALESMFQLAEPRDALVTAVARSVRRIGAVTDVDGTAMLLLGALVERCPGARSSMLGDLLGAEERARASGVLPLWLEALGTAGAPDALATAARHLQDHDEGVRGAAVAALRKLVAPEAIELLVRLATSDRSPSVRARAVDSLVESPARVSSTVFEAILTGDGDSRVRRAALLGLARRDGASPRTRMLLAAVAAQDSCGDLRQLAAEILRS